MSVILIGYDVESARIRHSDNIEQTERFVETAVALHNELKVPCTFYLCGQVIEYCADVIRFAKKESSLIDFEQHTYSHMLLKTVFEGNKMFKSGSIEEIRDEVRNTNIIIKEILGNDCIGLTGPYGYYRGLIDRPDILEVLHQEGIRFIRTYGRNFDDTFPTSLDIQPFWYGIQGFPDMLELNFNGYMDNVWRNKNGWEKVNEYIEYVKTNIDYICEKNLVYSYCGHDWSSITNDPDMNIIKGIINYGKSKGAKFLSGIEYYKLKNKEK